MNHNEGFNKILIGYITNKDNYTDLDMFLYE